MGWEILRTVAHARHRTQSCVQRQRVSGKQDMESCAEAESKWKRNRLESGGTRSRLMVGTKLEETC